MNEKLRALQAAGWKCAPCTCSGKKGWDCGHQAKRGFVVQLREYGFKLWKSGHMIASGHYYQLDKTMAEHGIS